MFPMRPLVALVMGTLWKILRAILLSSFLSPLSGVNLTDEKPLKEGGPGRPALLLENTGQKGLHDGPVPVNAKQLLK